MTPSRPPPVAGSGDELPHIVGDTSLPLENGSDTRPQPFAGPGGSRSSRDRFTPLGYVILGELGRGGMGMVYKATQINLQRPVALKMILIETYSDSRSITRFKAEAEAIARLQHPNIVQVYDIGEYEGIPYFSLEYIDGGSLSQFLTGQPQDVWTATHLVATLAAAIHAAHAKGIVHRDLKPANILLQWPTSEDDRDLMAVVPKITDFGLAKQVETQSSYTVTGAVFGTPNYMAPEQAWGRSAEICAATDVYALGVILYELLTGKLPFKCDSHLATLDKVRFEEPKAPSQIRPGIPAALDAMCLKCLRKEPKERYSSALLLARDLRQFLSSPESMRPVKRRPRRKWVLRIAGMLLLAGVAFAAGMLSRPPSPTGTASASEVPPPNAETPRPFVSRAARRTIPRVAIIQYVENPLLEEAIAGMNEGLNEAGLALGSAYTTSRYSAHGDPEELRAILSAVKTEHPDVIVTVTTPVMIAATREITAIPIVFMVASDPRTVGLFVGGTRPENLVGVHDDPPIEKLIQLALSREPELKAVGTLWHPGEPNSEVSAKKLRLVCERHHLKLIEQKVTTLEELASATATLCRGNVQIIVISADNLTTTGLTVIVERARQQGVPVYSTEPSMVKRGVTAAIGDDYHAWGRQSSKMLAKVLQGQPPAQLTIEPTATQRTVLSAEKKP